MPANSIIPSPFDWADDEPDECDCPPSWRHLPDCPLVRDEDDE